MEKQTLNIKEIELLTHWLNHGISVTRELGETNDDEAYFEQVGFLENYKKSLVSSLNLTDTEMETLKFNLFAAKKMVKQDLHKKINIEVSKKYLIGISNLLEQITELDSTFNTNTLYLSLDESHLLLDWIDCFITKNVNKMKELDSDDLKNIKSRTSYILHLFSIKEKLNAL